MANTSKNTNLWGGCRLFIHDDLTDEQTTEIESIKSITNQVIVKKYKETLMPTSYFNLGIKYRANKSLYRVKKTWNHQE